jgi:hypothetical protein
MRLMTISHDRRWIATRLCAKHQPQRVGSQHLFAFSNARPVATRCDWPFGHSRDRVLSATFNRIPDYHPETKFRRANT